MAVALLFGAAGCGRSTDPLAQLPFVAESATMRYFHEAGDVVDTARQESFNH